jgi:hypothetical protein
LLGTAVAAMAACSRRVFEPPGEITGIKESRLIGCQKATNPRKRAFS